MENIVRKAVEGGWNPRPEKKAGIKLDSIFPSEFDGEVAFLSSTFKESGKNNGRHFALYLTQIVCDPLFWQALGNSVNRTEWVMQERWVNYALNFHTKNLTEGWEKAVEYLQSIIVKEEK